MRGGRRLKRESSAAVPSCAVPVPRAMCRLEAVVLAPALAHVFHCDRRRTGGTFSRLRPPENRRAAADVALRDQPLGGDFMRRALLVFVLVGATAGAAFAASDHHVKAPLVSMGGSGVGGFVQLTGMPHGGTNIHVRATGLTPGTTYASFYYEASNCTGSHDLLGTFTANAAGVGHTHGKADDDLDEVGSVSVRTPDYFTMLFACATVG
jgi:hypothetical protein